LFPSKPTLPFVFIVPILFFIDDSRHHFTKVSFNNSFIFIFSQLYANDKLHLKTI
jgi:hypothetical protein